MTMKSITVLCLLSPISALICCALIDTAHAKAIVKPPAMPKGIDVNDDPSINVNGENAAPIIGILSMEVFDDRIKRQHPDKNFSSYIAGSYVKFVEGAGGRVVPIWIGKPHEYYEELLNKVNGVLFPGGATFFNESFGFAVAGQHIYEIAAEMNSVGNYMPIWGICLGFQLLVYLSANNTELRTNCASSSQALNLEFKEGFKKSRMFANATDNVISIFEKYPVTANFHRYCYTEKTFAENNMNDLWNVLSLNHDWNGIEFISSIEHKIYPFYGVQFHPEKNLYEFIPNRNITHISPAIIASQYFADYFINEARKNYNNFANRTEESNLLIYNYNPEYTGAYGSSFAQQYLFEAEEITHRIIKDGALSNRLQLMLLIGAVCLSALGSWRETLLL